MIMQIMMGDDAMLMMTNSGWWRESQDMKDIIMKMTMITKMTMIIR